MNHSGSGQRELLLDLREPHPRTCAAIAAPTEPAPPNPLRLQAEVVRTLVVPDDPVVSVGKRGQRGKGDIPRPFGTKFAHQVPRGRFDCRIDSLRGARVGLVHGTFYFSCFIGRPWGRRDDSNPSFSAVCEAQSFVPNGEPLRMQ